MNSTEYYTGAVFKTQDCSGRKRQETIKNVHLAIETSMSL